MLPYPDVDVFGVGAMLVLMLLIGVLVGASRLRRSVKWLIWAGLALRVVGAVGREMIAADAHLYFRYGARYAEYFARFDFSPLVDPMLWRGSDWLGTNFVAYPAGFVMTLIGPTWFGTFLAYALLALVGVAAYAVAFRRSFPHVDDTHYWAWLLLFPSLCFWPSSIGKEALMMLGLGVATLGYAGNGRRMNWLLLGAGLFFVFAIRPQVAAVFFFALVLAHWLSFRGWSAGRVLQGALILAVGLTGIWYALTLEAGGADLESIEGYVERNAALADTGGSAIGTTGVGLAAIPMAVVNVLFRPFLWEAHNAEALASALEMTLMWGLLWFRRRQLGAVLRVWRQHRMLRLAVPFVVLYVVALGMNLTNLGLLARQRVLVFPLLFLLFEAGNAFMRRRRQVAVPPPAARRPVPVGA